MCGKAFAEDAVFHRLVDLRKLRLAGYARQFRIAGVVLQPRGIGDGDAVMPFDLERRRGEEQRTGKARLATDAGLRDGFFAGEDGDALRQFGGRHIVFVDVVDGAGDGGAQPFGRETRDGANAGLAGGQFRPIVFFADAERADHADAGDGDDGTAGFVALAHDGPLQPTRSTSASPSPRQLPTLVTITCDSPDGLSPVSPLPAGANSLPCSSAAQAIPRLAGNWVSTPCPIYVPVLRTGRPKCLSAPRSAAVAGSIPLAPEMTPAWARSTLLAIVSHCRRSAASVSPDARKLRSEWISESRARGFAPRACACSGLSNTKNAPMVAKAMPPSGPRSQTGANFPASSTWPSSKASRTSQRAPL